MDSCCHRHEQELIGITYSEFDNKIGTRLKFQFPDNAISSDTFESFSEYVIVGKHLCGKVIIVRNEAIQYVNYSVAIDNPKYERNTLLFAIGFVLSNDANTIPFEPVLQNISSVLVTLETESEYLYKEKTKSGLSGLSNLLRAVYINILSTGEVTYRIDDSNVLNVKLFDSTALKQFEPVMLKDYSVPILVFQDVRTLSLLRWDISVDRVLHWIDGVSSVRKIAEDADMDIDCVKRCLRILHFYRCIIVTGIFQFSNMYVLTALGVQTLREEKKVIDEIEQFSAISGESTEVNEPVFCSGVEAFLLSLRPGYRLSEILLNFKHIIKRFDVRRVIAIAERFGIIQRIHEYPILRTDAPGASVLTDSDLSKEEYTSPTNYDKYKKEYLFDGSDTLESIGFDRELSAADIIGIGPTIVYK